MLGAFPGAPLLQPYRTVDDVVTAVAPFASDPVRAAARSYAEDAVACRILAIGAAIDGADRQNSPDHRGWRTEAQAADAVLKALGLAWFAHATGRGESAARVEAFRSLPAGRALLATWATVDVCLPARRRRRGPDDHHPPHGLHHPVVPIAGEHAMDGIGAVSDALAPVLQKVVDTAAKHPEPLAELLAPFVPGLIAASPDRVTPPPRADEQVATGSDRMPIYKWLAARLAAEHAAARAVLDGRPLAAEA